MTSFWSWNRSWLHKSQHFLLVFSKRKDLEVKWSRLSLQISSDSENIHRISWSPSAPSGSWARKSRRSWVACGVWAPISGPMIQAHGRVSCATCGNPQDKKAFGCLGNLREVWRRCYFLIVDLDWSWDTVSVIGDHAFETLFGEPWEDLTLGTPKVPSFSSMKTWKIRLVRRVQDMTGLRRRFVEAEVQGGNLGLSRHPAAVPPFTRHRDDGSSAALVDAHKNGYTWRWSGSCAFVI